RELRRQLEYEGVNEWRGNSDTETLLAMFSRYGVEETLQRAVGMFAIALWSKDEKALYLARDRFGEKPLYYGLLEGSVVFASELGAIEAYTDQRLEVDRDALVLLLRYGVIPPPHCICRGLWRVAAGSMVRIGLRLLAAGELLCSSGYWVGGAVGLSGEASSYQGFE